MSAKIGSVFCGRRLKTWINGVRPIVRSTRGLATDSGSRVRGTGLSNRSRLMVAGAAIVSAFGSAWMLQRQKNAKDTSASAARIPPAAADEKFRSEFVSAVAAVNTADSENAMPRRVIDLFTRVQNEICASVEKAEGASGARFKERRTVPAVKPGGRGVFKITRVLEDGKTFERAGCSITTSYGAMPLSYFEGKITAEPDAPAAATGQPAVFEPFRAVVDRLKSRPKSEQHTPMFSAAISLVFHPNNPHAPTVHANYRYFEVDDGSGSGNKLCWFGGGSDLTPHYLYPEDVIHFHSTLSSIANKHDPRYYPAFKAWADKYFYLKHRRETRGVGGMFFDTLSTQDTNPTSFGYGKTSNQLLSFVSDAAHGFVISYFPIVDRRKSTSTTAQQTEWARIRHGRYAEFNLLHDEGTKYGLKNPAADVDAIFMSLPRSTTWSAAAIMEDKPIGTVPGTPEFAMQQVLKQPRDWLAAAGIDQPIQFAPPPTIAIATAAVTAPVAVTTKAT